MSIEPAEAEGTPRERLAAEIGSLFAAARNERFEDGFDSILSLEVQRLAIANGEAALEIVSELILGERVAPEAAAEALACLGQVQSKATREARRRLLERCLACSSHVVRDGAVVGLSSLRDVRSLSALDAAAAREPYRLLRNNVLQLAEQLRSQQP